MFDDDVVLIIVVIVFHPMHPYNYPSDCFSGSGFVICHSSSRSSASVPVPVMLTVMTTVAMMIIF